MSKTNKDFASLVRMLRENRGMSLRQLEGATGISNGYLSQIESGKVGAPSPKIIQKLATALDYPYIDLMDTAGHLTPQISKGEFLRLGSQTLSLEDLTQQEKSDLLEFVELLKARRHRNAT